MSLTFPTGFIRVPSGITATPSGVKRPAFGTLYGFDAQQNSYTPALVNTFTALSLSDGNFGGYVDSFYSVPAAGTTLTNGAGHTFTIFPATSVRTNGSSSFTAKITLDSEVTNQVRLMWGAVDGSMEGTIYATDMVATYGASAQGLQTGSDTTLDADDWEDEASVGSPTYAADTTLTEVRTGIASGSWVYYQWVFHPTSGHAQYTTPVQRQLLAA